MKKRVTEAQIVGVLQEADAGLPVKNLCRKHGFSDASYYLWRSKFGGMTMSYSKRSRPREGEVRGDRRRAVGVAWQSEASEARREMFGDRPGGSRPQGRGPQDRSPEADDLTAQARSPEASVVSREGVEPSTNRLRDPKKHDTQGAES